jgi:RNA polymerase sigma-70 factor (ECF subfamily)
LKQSNNEPQVAGDGVCELALAQHIDGGRPAAGPPGPNLSETVPHDAAAEEAGWVERARRGDLEAFDAIVARYEGRLLRFLTGMVGDVEIARELCQDTFLAAYQALPRLHGELHLSAWLHTIAMNRARSHHRRKKFKVFVPIEDHDLPSPGADLQASIAETDLVRLTLARMPKQYAEALLLQLAGGLSCKEMANALNCSESAIKVRLMRARDSFRRLYEEEGGQCTT